MNTKHTPTPWVVGGRAKLGASIAPGETPRIWAPDGAIADISIHRMLGDGTSKRELANANFIVRACNAHDDLVAALEGLTRFVEAVRCQVGMGPGQLKRFEAAKAALTKAKE